MTKSEQTGSLDSWMGKNPEEVKHQKLAKLEDRVEKVRKDWSGAGCKGGAGFSCRHSFDT